MHRIFLFAGLFVGLFCGILLAAEPVDSTQRGQARSILDATGIQGGLIVHVGCGDGTLTAALGSNEGFVVQGLDTDADRVQKSRERIRSAGLCGRVSVDRFDGRRLPYVDNLVNLIVAEELGEVPASEVSRVLCPLGVAYVKQDGTWTKTVKPRPESIDEWTHWLHGPDGNAVADDLEVGPPRHAQWVADPRWQRHHEASPSVDAMVSAGGRVFAIINEAPAGIDGMPDRWALVARDAFNGTLLWKRPIDAWGWSQWSDHSHGNGRWNQPTHIARRLVAVDARVYVTLGFNAPLTALDAATGRTLTTYPESQFTDEILYDAGTLFLATSNAAQGPGHIADRPAEKKSVVSLDAQTGKLLWKAGDFSGAASKADAIERVTHLTMVLGGGKVFFVEENGVVALDRETGKQVWRRDRPPRSKPVTYGSYYFTNLCSLVYHDGLVLFTEPDPTVKRLPWNAPAQSILFGLSAETGEEIWTRECGVWGHYNPGDLFLIDGLAWVHDAEAFSMHALDPRTGEVKRTFSTQEALDQGHHHRCYRNKATTRYFVTGRRGVEFINIDSEENQRHHWVRGTCRYGVMPANGLLYAPPHPCICYVTAKLTGFWALAAADQDEKLAETSGDERTNALERGPAFGDAASAPLATSSEDWPTYRHDIARSGCASTTIPDDGLEIAWKTPLGGRPSSSVIADGRVFVTTPDTHAVWALDATHGQPLWSYTTGGRVDTPPTVHRDRVLFGSADGWIYSLRAADGELAWRRRAVPDDTRMMSRDQLESVWPIHGSVLVQNDTAYFAAGRSSFLDGGIRLLAVDPRTGELIAETRVDSIDPETNDMVECLLRYDMPSHAPGALPDVLVGDGTNFFMRHLRFEPTNLEHDNTTQTQATETKQTRPPTASMHLTSTAGLLDDSWFNQTYWTVDGKSHCKLLVFNEQGAYGIKPFPAAARHSRAMFRPGAKGYTLFAADRPAHKRRWARQASLRGVAMLLSENTLFVAGSPDVVDPEDPWGAFEGRKGGLVWALSTDNGEKLAEYPLDSPPTFDGMAAAGGRLYVSTIDGHLVCLGRVRRDAP